jgi:hypothetical protein
VARGPPGWIQRQTSKTGSKEIKARSKARKARFLAAIHNPEGNNTALLNKSDFHRRGCELA